MVVVIGKKDGGWSDFYMTQRFWPAWVSIILMLILGWGVSTALRRVQNWRNEQARKRLTQLWVDDLSPAELGIEAFGLGRYMGKHCDAHDLNIPVDIFLMMEERYGVPVDRLSRAFVKGATDAIKGKGDD